MAAISRIFGGFRFRTLMSKAATTEAVTVAGRERKGILKTLPVSQQLASFAGEIELTRGSAVKKVWEYVKLHNLQVY